MSPSEPFFGDVAAADVLFVLLLTKSIGSVARTTILPTAVGSAAVIWMVLETNTEIC